MQYTPLPDRALLKLSGEDTVSFLQGLVSNDVAKLKPGQAVYAALLSPQGKYLHDFFLIADGDAVLLDGEKHRLDDLLKRLQLYKLRSKVTIDRLPENIGVAALWGKGDAPKDAFADPRLPQLGWRMIGDMGKILGFERATPEDYDRHRLALGVPDGSRDMTPDRSLLLECGFEELHGVDFKKGCYVGQEVTARSKFRAQLRKFLYQVTSLAGELPEAGTEIKAGDTVVGEMRSHAGNTGLALVRTEELESSKGAAILAAGLPVTVALPAWRVPGISAA
jgi:tRNA-modifying protein YgfZ